MATNSRHRKNHKEKVAARKKRLVEEKARMNKLQREFIMNLIKQEQEKGLFENSKAVDSDGPIINDLIVDGPVFDLNTTTEEIVNLTETTENDEVENVVSEESSENEIN